MKTKLILFLTICLAASVEVFSQGMIAKPATYITVIGPGQIIVDNGDFTLQSTSTAASGTASLVVTNASGSVTATGSNHFCNVEQFLTASEWHFISPPISDGLAGIFLDQYLRTLDESTNNWGNWIVPVTTPLVPGTGYACWPITTQAFTYSGTLNNGALSPTVFWTDALHGNNLVGNPYASAIDWNASSGWTKTHIGTTIWIWNPADLQYGTYNNPTSIHGVTNIIPIGQGFIVQAIAASPVLSMDNRVRVHNTTQPFLKSGTLPNMELRVDGNNYMDEWVVRFIPESSGKYDPMYDALKMSGSAETPQLYSYKPDRDDKVAICSYPEIQPQMIIPVGLTVGASTSYIITASNLETIDPEVVIYLEDKQTGKMQDLRANPKYDFTANVADDPNRFIVLFSMPVIGTGDQADQQQVQIYSFGNTIYIQKNGNEDFNGNVFIYDLLGREFYSGTISGAVITKLSPDVVTGCYIVRVITDTGSYTQKVMLKN